MEKFNKVYTKDECILEILRIAKERSTRHQRGTIDTDYLIGDLEMVESCCDAIKGIIDSNKEEYTYYQLEAYKLGAMSNHIQKYLDRQAKKYDKPAQINSNAKWEYEEDENKDESLKAKFNNALTPLNNTIAMIERFIGESDEEKKATIIKYIVKGKDSLDKSLTRLSNLIKRIDE